MLLFLASIKDEATRAQRNQKKGQSCDLHPGQTVSTAPNFAFKAAALPTLSHFSLGCQVTARLAVGSAGVEGPCHHRTRQVSLPSPPALAAKCGGRGWGQGVESKGQLKAREPVAKGGARGTRIQGM